MKIAPIDIAHKTFTRKMMGLDADEVTDFMRSIADEMENLIRERNDLREAVREKEMAILEFKERDELLKNTITTATKMSDKIQSDAEREARLILNDAQQKADMIVRDSRDSLKKIFNDISELKKIRLQFENNIRAVVQSHVAMLDQGNKIMPNPEFEVPSLQFSAQSAVTEVEAAAAQTPAVEANRIADNVEQAIRSAAKRGNDL